jgi:DNA replication protein DnaC
MRRQKQASRMNNHRAIHPQDLLALTRQIQNETGLDERTAEQIALAQLAPPGPASAPITPDLVSQALTAPPTLNEPDVIPPRRECPDCNGAGWFLEAVPYGHPNFGKLWPCRCTTDARAERAKAQQIEILSRLQDDLGSELWHCRLEAFNVSRGCDSQSRDALTFALSAAQSFLTDPRRWLYFYGPAGVGKSHLAAGIALEWAERGLGRVAYASLPKLLRFIRAGFKDGSGDERLTALQVVDLLILDDLGTEYHKSGDGFSHTDSVLFELINERYLYDRATIITSNLELDDLEQRIASRIRGKARRILIDNDDQRGAP